MQPATLHMLGYIAAGGAVLIVIVAIALAFATAWDRQVIAGFASLLVTVALAASASSFAVETQKCAEIIACRNTAEVSIDSHRTGDDFPICTQLKGKAKLASDEAVVIGIHAKNEPRWYFESNVKFVGSNWDVDLTLGNPKEKGMRQYAIEALVIPKRWVSYLPTTHLTAKGQTYWSSPDLPPDILTHADITVRRIPAGSSC